MADTSIMVIAPEMTAVQLFAPGKADTILAEIKEKARAEASTLDISTEGGRTAIAALAYKIARTKTATDKLRLDLVAAEKKRLKLIDAEGGRLWDELEALQKEVRKPLTDWEQIDKLRIATHEEAIAGLESAGIVTLQDWQTLPLEAMKERLAEIAADFPSTHDWQEFGSRGALAVKTATAKITEAITKRETYEAEQAELVRLRAEAAKRDQQEREAAAAAKAKAEAEEAAERQRIAAELKATAALAEAAKKAKDEQERIQRETKEREEKTAREAAEREAAIERERKAAQDRAEKAERERIEAEAKSRRDAEAAAQKAEEEKQAAVRAEQERAERERKAEEEAERKRAANRAHAAKVNNEAKACLLNHTNLTAENAEEVIKAIAKGLVSHVSISY